MTHLGRAVCWLVGAMALPASLAAAPRSAAKAPHAAPSAVWQDARGDDHGPGGYVYPLGAQPAGALDLLQVRAVWRADGWRWSLTFRKPYSATLRPVVHIYLDTDGIAGSGHPGPLPGLGQTRLAPDAAWEKALLLTPQPLPMVEAALRTKAAAQRGAVLLPVTSRWKGSEWTVQLAPDALGPPRPGWRIAVAVLAASEQPPADALFSMPVRARATAQQLGGGVDAACCSHAIDILADLRPAAATARGAGAPNAQHAALAFACGEVVPSLPMQPWPIRP